MLIAKSHSRNSKYPLISLSISFILVFHLLLSALPGWAEMYRCQDPSGTTVLTDNPAQLNECSKLETAAISTTTKPTRLIQPRPPQTPTSNIDNTHQRASSPQNAKQKHNQGQDITIPLQKLGGSFVVQVRLNNERIAHLIVDTGASMTVLSTTVAIDLGILGTTDNELLTVNTAGGSVQVNMNYLTSLTVGTAQAEHVAIAIHDLPDIPEKIEGLLGMSFLKHFLVTLDAEHAQLILRQKPTS